MATKTYKPTTPSRRNMVTPSFAEITKKKPEKNLVTVLKKNAGRNNTGRITVRHHGGGNRQKYRIIDFKRNADVTNKVIAIEYDPNRTAYIALLEDENAKRSYVIAPNGLSVGDVLYSGEHADIKTGNVLPLSAIPVGTFIHAIELYPAAAHSSSAPRAQPRSLWPRRTARHRSGFPPARSDSCVSTARLQ